MSLTLVIYNDWRIKENTHSGPLHHLPIPEPVAPASGAVELSATDVLAADVKLPRFPKSNMNWLPRSLSARPPKVFAWLAEQ